MNLVLHWVGPYEWLTYQEVYEYSLRIGSAISSRCVELACCSQSMTSVPLYDTLGAHAVEFIINHAEVSIAFVQENKILSGVLDCELPPKQKTDICKIMYTIGTTGEPKGVILTNGAIMAEVLSVDDLLFLTDTVASEEDSYFSFLPLAYVFDQIMELYRMYRGSSIGFWRGDVRYLMEDIAILNGGHSGTKANKLQNLEKGLPQDKAAPLFDRLVFDKLFTPDMLKLIGLTESCGGCFTSIANVLSMMGTVGIPVTTIEARLESVPEMGYDALGSVPHGEICLRGKTLFSGYYKREDLTKEAFVDRGFIQIWVYGNSFESFLVAVAVPDKKALEDWAVNHSLTDDFISLCNYGKARKYILDEINSIGQKHQLRGFETLKAAHLDPIPFDMERDLITPTFKLKRPQLLKYYT
ncbi:long chain acyl-CoA synthetase 2-like [Tripterygium wilfordii]|uniref:Long chain acyl-CoA synthetase 2-like n=1 Tax=Tripterygium wilfordii TaxID=458696 RepID=A0A7J7DH79_TRIWF|nr:long chain acyl-CoA synthetase 2-like [Tripterygium wilfordii]